MKTLHIPKIDVAPIIDPITSWHIREKTIMQIHEALGETWFMTITNHSISSGQFKELFWEYKEFFEKPLEDKMWSHINNLYRWYVPLRWEHVNPDENPDYKECYDTMLELSEDDEYVRRGIGLYGPNQWPSDMPYMKNIVNTYYQDACTLWSDVLEAVAEVLGVPGFFKDKFTKPAAMLRVNYYPSRPIDATKSDFGIAAHTDYGCLTILAQNGVSGLEVQAKTGEWIPVEPEDNDIVVNVWEVLEKFTWWKLRATPHRVIGSAQERMSLPLFYNPNYDTPLIPLWEDQSKPHWVMTTGEYIESRYDATYKK